MSTKLKPGDAVYVAGPYTTGNPNTNVRQAISYGEITRRAGLLPFVPHLYHLWDLANPHEYEYWMGLCLGWVVRCQAVLRLPGQSSGADRECALAREHGIPVFTDIVELLNAINREE